VGCCVEAEHFLFLRHAEPDGEIDNLENDEGGDAGEGDGGANSDELLDQLIDAGLLEGAGPERYTLQQTLVDYASAREDNSAACERMVEFFVKSVEVHETDYETLDREASNVLAALDVAFERGMSTFLIRGALHFIVFLKWRGLYELAESHLKHAEQAARSLYDVASLTRILYHQEEITDLRKVAVCSVS